MDLERIKGKGILFIGDPHLASPPPGQRLDSFADEILDKLESCFKESVKRDLVPLILGDLFHRPRDNSNSLLVDIITLFKKYRPFVLIGNHDKYQARYTDDVSMAVLDIAGAVRLIKEDGPKFILETDQGEVLVGGSPDRTPIPKSFDRSSGEFYKVVWVTHHDINFPDVKKSYTSIKEIEGIDWVVNGHIHGFRETVVKGMTYWANPGNISRTAFSRKSLERKPAAGIWTPDCTDLKRWEIPHKDFWEVFPKQDFPPEDQENKISESQFLKGLERLAWRKTEDGAGLKDFLKENIDPNDPESELIWDLYKEVTENGNE